MSPLKTERFELRLDEQILERIDRWRADQVDIPTRSEAMRRLVEKGLDRNTGVRLTNGEKLITTMLCDISRGLKLDKEIKADFVESVIFGGHYWALEWEHSMLFHGEEDSRQDVSLVVDVLDMWAFIESSYERLSQENKDRISAAPEVSPYGRHVKFAGFDGHGEVALVSIARFLVEKMSRFTSFAGRDFDSHCPKVEAYQRMLRIFEPIRPTLSGRDLNVPQLIAILAAQK